MQAKASGASDTPEDLLGGFKAMLRLSWHAHVRVAIWLGDAPCHGSEYYDATDADGRPVPSDLFDNYPNGDPDVRLLSEP